MPSVAVIYRHFAGAGALRDGGDGKLAMNANERGFAAEAALVKESRPTVTRRMHGKQEIGTDLWDAATGESWRAYQMEHDVEQELSNFDSLAPKSFV